MKVSSGHMKLGSLPRRNNYHQKPIAPKPEKIKYRYTILGWVSDRSQYYTNYSREDDCEEKDDDQVDGQVNDKQSISLQEVNDLVKIKGLNEKDIYFMAAFDEDHLHLEVVHVHKMSYEEQVMEYDKELTEWEAQEKILQKYEEEKIQKEMKSLQRRAEELNKKKSLKDIEPGKII